MTQYVYASDWDSSTGDIPSLDETRKNALLEMASELYDQVTQTAPGHWGPIASSTFTFDARGGDTLWLRGEDGAQYLLRTVTADKIEIDTDLDGDYDYTWDLTDAWVEGFPRNAVTHGAAFTALRIKPVTSAPMLMWPKLVGSVRITGTWGYAAAPEAVRQSVIDIAHSLSQRLYAGGYGQDRELQMPSDTAWVMRLVHRRYTHRIPPVA